MNEQSEYGQSPLVFHWIWNQALELQTRSKHLGLSEQYQKFPTRVILHRDHRLGTSIEERAGGAKNLFQKQSSRRVNLLCTVT